MASRKKRPSDEPTKPLNLDEAFDVTLGPEPATFGFIVTGLSDEEDAGRFLAQQFDPELYTCRKCGFVCKRCVDNQFTDYCDHCMQDLWRKITSRKKWP